jgi:sRNA-binding protein
MAELRDIVGRARQDFAATANRQIYTVWRTRFDPDPLPTKEQMQAVKAHREWLHRQAQQQRTKSSEQQKAEQQQKRNTHKQRLTRLEQQAAMHKESGPPPKTPSDKKPPAAAKSAPAEPAATRKSSVSPAGVSFQTRAE